MSEYEKLLQRVREVDLSYRNSHMQQIVQLELETWVESYNTKKEKEIHDYFGGPGEIPEKIEVLGQTYSPPEILEHTKARDEIGMEVIRSILDFQKHHPLYNTNENLADLLDGLYQNHNLDEIFMSCACGKHNKSLRDIFLDVVEPSYESILLRAGIKDSLIKWYGGPNRYSLFDEDLDDEELDSLFKELEDPESKN